jgi:N-acetylglucosamine malate deacetylase 1
MKKRILVLAAHLDDEVLGVGGTIARNIAEGNEVFIDIIREGIAERHKDPSSIDGTKKEYVKKCAINCANVLGVPSENVIFGGFSLYEPFEYIHQLGKKLVPPHIEEVMKKVNPDEIFTMHPGDTHADHHIVYKSTELATRAISSSIGHLKKVYTYETPSSTDQMFPDSSNVFLPNTFVDITSFLSKKLDAFSQYVTEQADLTLFPNHSRSLDKIRATAEYRGAQSNMRYAEAFNLIRHFIR